MSATRKTLLAGVSAAALAAFCALILAVAPAADASTIIHIDPDDVPTTAKDFKHHSCNHVPDDIGKHQDGWVFFLVGGKKFKNVTAYFEDRTGDGHSRDAHVVRGNKARAYVITPAGWTLVDAQAELRNDAERGGHHSDFKLKHTCPGTPKHHHPPTETPTPSDSTSPSPSGSTSSSPSPSTSTTSGSPSPSTSGSSSGSPSPSGSTGPSSSSPPPPGGPDTTPPGGGQTRPGSPLPVTGASMTGLVATGVLLLGGGAALLLARRRRALGERD